MTEIDWNTINLVMATKDPDVISDDKNLAQIVRYYRQLRGKHVGDEEAKVEKDDAPKKSALKLLQKIGKLKENPQEEDRRA